jgi:hypothetical protein
MASSSVVFILDIIKTHLAILELKIVGRQTKMFSTIFFLFMHTVHRMHNNVNT